MAPSNMAVFAPAIPLMDMPFLFRDLDHWNAVLSSDVLKPLEDELYEKADIKVIGYAGCLLYTSPSPRDGLLSRMPSSA